MKRKFYLSIIPHQPSGNKGVWFFIAIFFVLAIFLTISIFLIFHLIGQGSSVLISEKDIERVAKENIVLKKTKNEVENRLNISRKKAEELKEISKTIEPLVGIQKIPKDDKFNLEGLSVGERLDSLLIISKKNRNIYNYAHNKLTKNKKLSASVPSIKPIKGWIVKGYGHINDLFTDEIRLHPGITFSAMRGTPVYATGSGYIIRKGTESGIGLFVVINHGFGYITKYGHLQSIRVEEGDYVTRNHIIGYAGKTGRVTGPCLYYEVIQNGKRTDPINFIFDYVETMKPGTDNESILQ
jgi:murein DD-endopeptidase MepM/ murein hydrolase activator NlpD